MGFKRFLAALLALLLPFSCVAFAKDDVIIADRTVHTVSPGLVYTSSVELHKGYRQEIYSFEYTPGSDTAILPVYGKYIYGTSSVGQGISDYDGESRVVGGINTDFFITSTGIPLSCLVEGREVISSCDARAAIGFDESGNATIGFPGITSRLYFGDEEFQIAHINKTPAIWGFYLVTDKFYSTTKSSVESIEIVLRPFTSENTEDDLIEEDENEVGKEISSDEDEKTDAEGGNEKAEIALEAEAEEKADPEIEELDDESVQQELFFDFLDYSFTDDNIEINSELQLVITEIRDNSMNSEIPVDSFVLCVPKEQFGGTVAHLKVGDELVLKTDISQSFENCINIFGAGDIILEYGEFTEISNDSIFTSRQPRTAVGLKENGEVVFVCVDGRRIGESHGFTIKELSEYLKSKGCVTALNFDGGGSTTFYAADIGESYASLKNIPSDGYERRVADGLIFLNTSKKGKEPAYAAKYPGNHLIFNDKVELELSGDILFADEKLYPIIPDEDDFSIFVDSDFGNTKDGIFIPNGKTGSADIILRAGEGDSYSEFIIGHVDIVDTVSDFNINSEDTHINPFEESAVFEISVSHNTLPIEYSSESIVWEIYIKDEAETEAEAEESEEDELIENEAKVDGDEVKPEPEEAEAKDDVTNENNGNDSDITAEVLTEKTEDEEHKEETEQPNVIESYTQGYIKASIYDAIFDNINFEFYPITEGKEYRLIARLGKSYAYIDITSEKYPFVDTEKHWATKTAYEMYRDGYFSGELDNDGTRYFMPERNMTRSEFCVVVGRILGINIAQESKSSTTREISESNASVSDDIIESDNQLSNEIIENAEYTLNEPEVQKKQDFYDVPEWALGYVEQLYNMGYIDNFVTSDENGILFLDSQKTITRIDVVTVFAKLLDFFLIEYFDEMLSEFTDIEALTTEQKLSTAKLVLSGIIKGYGDNTLRLASNITRAEVATIFQRYISLRNFILEGQD